MGWGKKFRSHIGSGYIWFGEVSSQSNLCLLLYQEAIADITLNSEKYGVVQEIIAQTTMEATSPYTP